MGTVMDMQVFQPLGLQLYKSGQYTVLYSFLNLHLCFH